MSPGATNRGRRPARGVDPGRRLSLLVAGAAVLASTGLAAVGIWRLWQVPVERVVFGGDARRVPQAQLQALVNDNLRAGFFSVDIEQIRTPLEAHPWVFKVVVKRRWPGHLEIQVTEQTPIARWGDDAYLNHRGEVFRPARYESMPGLPRLRGPRGSQLALMQRYQYMRERLQALDLELVALSMDARGGLRARLGTGSELVFGRGRPEEKLARFVGVYQADLADRASAIRTVDLRYRHGLAVAWRTAGLDVYRG